jgi:hypothetical protein
MLYTAVLDPVDKSLQRDTTPVAPTCTSMPKSPWSFWITQSAMVVEPEGRLMTAPPLSGLRRVKPSKVAPVSLDVTAAPLAFASMMVGFATQLRWLMIVSVPAKPP